MTIDGVMNLAHLAILAERFVEVNDELVPERLKSTQCSLLRPSAEPSAPL